jgi:hypothetical protein
MEEGRLELEEHNTCWCCGGDGLVLGPWGASPQVVACGRTLRFYPLVVLPQKVGIVQVVAARSSAFSREAGYLLAFAFKLIEGLSGDMSKELQHRAVLSPCGQIPECPNDAFQLLMSCAQATGRRDAERGRVRSAVTRTARA